VTPGPQAQWFSDDLYAARYTVSEDSNRMGIRLRGPMLASPGGHMITEGVPLGAVQAPPDGQPIVLFVEHQTTGGYPAGQRDFRDFWRLGQLRPRDEVRFERHDGGSGRVITGAGGVVVLAGDDADRFELRYG
jgi:allophanate hydrolase subunit 2